MSKIGITRILSLALGWGIAWQAHSQECFAPSPNFTAQGDLYYDLDASYSVPLADQKQFIALASQLGNHLTGVGHKVECLGNERNARLSYQDVTLKAQVMANLAAGLKIQAELNDTKTKTIKGLSLAFLGNVPSFQFINYGNNHFSFSQKLRHKLAVFDAEENSDKAEDKARRGDSKPIPQPKGGNRLEELLIDIQFTGGGVIIRIDRYANGFYYATENFELAGVRNNVGG